MSRTKSIVIALLAAAVFGSQTGCAFFTARRVAMTAGKEVGKAAIKKSKEDKAKENPPHGNP